MMTLTEDNINKLLQGLRAGSDLQTSAFFSEIDFDELITFLDFAGGRASKKQKEAEALLNKIKQARAAAILQAQTRISAAAGEDWRAAAWYLERTLPEIYGRKG